MNCEALVRADVIPGPSEGQRLTRLGPGCRVAAAFADGLLSLQRRRPAPKVEMGTSSHNGVDLSWIPQETLNQISTCDITSCTAALPLVLSASVWRFGPSTHDWLLGCTVAPLLLLVCCTNCFISDQKHQNP